MSLSEVAVIIAVALFISLPWIAAVIFAVKEVSRTPSPFTVLMLVVVVVGSIPVAPVYLTYLAWRRSRTPPQRATPPGPARSPQS